MAIVKMKRLRLIAMQQSREELLKALQHAGCVEITQPEEEDGQDRWAGLRHPDSAALNKARDDLAAATTALAAAKKYAPKAGLLSARPTVEAGRFFDDGAYAAALELAAQVNAAGRRMQELQAEEVKLHTQQAALSPWRRLDVPLDVASTQQVTVQLGTIPSRSSLEGFIAALTEAAPLSQVIPASSDTDAHYLLFLCHRSQEEEAGAVLREFGFAPAPLKGWTGTAAENLAAARSRLGQIEAELTAQQEKLTELAARKDELAACADRAAVELRRQEAKAKLLDTDAAYYLDGWVPAEQVEELGKALKPFICAWEVSDPGEEEYPSVPVKLKNNWFTRPLSMVTDMYSLPAYNGVDPNPLMAPFFILFYGLMMADMGYGLLMMLASLVIQKKTRPNGPTMRHMIPLLGLAGASTFLFGALTGGFFGDLIPQLIKMYRPESTFALPSLFSPLDDALAVLVGSLALGVVQIFTGMAISMRIKIKRGQVMDALCSEGAWYLVFVLLAAGIITGYLKPCLIAILVLLVLTQGYGKKGVVGKLVGIGGSLYNNITGYFSDILSYSRLMALMLAGAVIAQVFNTLGGITGNAVTFFLIATVGNLLNFALNLLGCYVHDMRLQCLEFFGRFYEDGGKPFRPLETATQYVDVIQDK